MKYLEENLTLSNGIKMPAISFGTWRMWCREDMGATPTLYAGQNGCMAFDTAQAYNTEIGVGVAIKKFNAKRENIFLSTKLDPDRVYDAYSARKGIEESLMNLQVDYLDCMYIHAPTSWDRSVKNDNLAIYKELEMAYKEGKIKNIGLSNFNIEQMKEILNNCEIKPTVVQLPVSIGYANKEMVEFCKQNGIQPIAYSPIASGNLLRSELVQNLARKYNTTPANVCLDYAGQVCGAVCFGSENEHHIAQNLQTEKLLSKEDVEKLNNIKDDRRQWDYIKGWKETETIR